MDPSEILALIKDNVVVQWFLVVVFILTVGTSTATKVKGPIGTFARWVRSIGEKRDEREAAERRERRLQLIQEAREGGEYVQAEVEQLREQIRYLYENQSALEGLIRVHLAWDYERVRQLIEHGVSPGDIPSPPPLRVELKNPDTVPQRRLPRHAKLSDPGGNVQAQPTPD